MARVPEGRTTTRPTSMLRHELLPTLISAIVREMGSGVQLVYASQRNGEMKREIKSRVENQKKCRREEEQVAYLLVLSNGARRIAQVPSSRFQDPKILVCSEIRALSKKLRRIAAPEPLGRTSAG